VGARSYFLFIQNHTQSSCFFFFGGGEGSSYAFCLGVATAAVVAAGLRGSSHVVVRVLWLIKYGTPSSACAISHPCGSLPPSVLPPFLAACLPLGSSHYLRRGRWVKTDESLTVVVLFFVLIKYVRPSAVFARVHPGGRW